ncbi:MAG: hypothetical protein IJ848_02245 [Alphaproteobacteria bacterium]|nr:hypothetical protein [Alphaproteobacteria bacterium]
MYASFWDLFTKSKLKDDNTQVLDSDGKSIELKVPINSDLLKQIKKINDETSKTDNKIKDSNFNVIQSQQNEILSIINDYHYDKNIFSTCKSKIELVIHDTNSYIDFYNKFITKISSSHTIDKIKKLRELISEFNKELELLSKKSLIELNDSFMTILTVIDFIKIIFKDNNGLIKKVQLLDNTVGLNENEIKYTLSNYVHDLCILLEPDIVKYYDDILSEVDAKTRTKNTILPSQLLFILFNTVKGELYSKYDKLYELYVSFNKHTNIINRKLEDINDYIKYDTLLNNNNTDKDPVNDICVFINKRIKEKNRYSKDVISEIEKLKNVVNSIIEYLTKFDKYNPDENIISSIEERKIQHSNNQAKTSNKSDTDEKKDLDSSIESTNTNKQTHNKEIAHITVNNDNNKDTRNLNNNDDTANDKDSNISKSNSRETDKLDNNNGNKTTNDNNNNEHTNNLDNTQNMNSSNKHNTQHNISNLNTNITDNNEEKINNTTDNTSNDHKHDISNEKSNGVQPNNNALVTENNTSDNINNDISNKEATNNVNHNNETVVDLDSNAKTSAHNPCSLKNKYNSSCPFILSKIRHSTSIKQIFDEVKNMRNDTR